MKKPKAGKSSKTRNHARVVVEEKDTRVRHVVDISAPKTFFGVWRMSQAKPRRASARVIVGCSDGRVTFTYRWNKGTDERTKGALQAGVEQAVRWVSKQEARYVNSVCLMKAGR